MSHTCSSCNVKADIEEFASCSVCKLLTHICSNTFKNAKINAEFIKNAEVSGFRYICTKCAPSLKSFSVTCCNIQSQLDTINNTMRSIIKEVKDVQKMQTANKNAASLVDKLPSFSDVVKESTLVLTPKDPAMNVKQLKDKVRHSIDPETNVITGLHTTQSNKVILKSGNGDADAFALSVKDKLNDDFDITVHKNDTRQLKIIRFENSNHSHEEICSAIVSQNVVIDKQKSNIKIVKETKYRDNDKQSILIVQLDPLSHKRAIEQGYLCIKWRKYKIFDALTIPRCFKCSRLGHIAKTCKSKNPTCSNCAESHPVEECQSTQSKCVNCLDAISKFHITICPNHPSHSLKCPTMLERLTKRKDAINRSS